MTIEEKAKAYDEALERGKQILNTPYTAHWDVMKEVTEHLLPELKESEDELHRKWILEYLYDGLRKSDEQFKDQFKCAIAWFEKQGEQKPQIKLVFPKFRVGDIVKSKSQPMLLPRKINSIDKDGYRCEDCSFIGFAWESDCELVEQKPTEWSEEDKEKIRYISEIIRSYAYHNGYMDVDDTLNDKGLIEADEWLKSLRPHSKWKPTEEQVEAFGYAIKLCDGEGEKGRYYLQFLYKLMNDFKAL